MHKTSIRFGASRHAMEVENISTYLACPRASKRTESLMLSQVRSIRVGETSVMENRLKNANCAQVYPVVHVRGCIYRVLAW